MCLFSPIGDFFCLQTLPACRHFHEKLFWPFLPAPNTQQMWQQCWQTLFISSPVLLGLSTWFKNLYIVWSPHQCISWNRDLRRLRHAATSRHVDAGARLCIDWHTLKPCSRQVENLRSVWSWSADIWGTHTHTHTHTHRFLAFIERYLFSLFFYHHCLVVQSQTVQHHFAAVTLLVEFWTWTLARFYFLFLHQSTIFGRT